MKTDKTDILPAIQWERGELVEKHDHVREFGCSGESEDGRLWSGTWNETDGEYIEIDNIEEL
jgi:hypothetical protein